jgi:hypothetical protein
MKKTILTLLIIFISTGIHSQKLYDIITDRPDQTESAVTVPKGFFQAEIGVSMEGDKYSGLFNQQDLTMKTYSAPGILLRYGLTKNIELRLASEFISAKTTAELQTFPPTSFETTQSGVGPLVLGTKFELVKETKSFPQTAFIFHLTIPVGDNAFQPGNTGADFRFAMSHSLSERFALSYNLGGEWNGNSPAPTGIYTLSLAISLVRNFSMFVESYGFLPQGDSPDHRLDGGFTYLIAKNVQADISAGIGINEKSPDYFIGGGISFRLPR